MKVTRRLLKAAVAALLIVLSSAPVSLHAQAQPQAAPAYPRVPITAGRSTVLATDFDITRIAVTNPAIADAVGRAHGEVFGAARPAATMVVVSALIDPRWKVEIEAEAIVSVD